MFEPTITKVSEDARGEMYAITLPGDRELMLLHSKQGSLRGGHSHDVDEGVMVLLGAMIYHKRAGSGEMTGVLKEGGYSFNPTGLAHMGEFLGDTWLVEWKLNTQKGKWKNIDDETWRKQVVAHAAG